MLKAVFLRGLPASGKSTWAREKILEGHGDWVRVNRDDLRWMLHEYKFSNNREKLVMKIRNMIIGQAIFDGKNIIVDETFLNPKTLQAATSFVEQRAKHEGKQYEIEVRDFEKPLQQCIVDDRKRPNSVGEGVIRRMHNQWIAPSLGDKVMVDLDKSFVVLCDLDGTVADISHRDPYDGGKCLDDKPRGPVVEAVRNYLDRGERVIFVSARDDEHFDKTLQWLRDHVSDRIDRTDLLMRETGDRRDDAIVKREILDEQILPNWNVKAVFDDRPKVIRMWRDAGIFVFDVGDGVEF